MRKTLPVLLLLTLLISPSPSKHRQKPSTVIQTDELSARSIVARASRARSTVASVPVSTTTSSSLPTKTTSVQSGVHTKPSGTNAVHSTIAPSGDIWWRLALCESGGNAADNTGNGYYGAFQFSLKTWKSVGGSGLPSNATYDEQLGRAKILQARSGWGQWPACSKKLGLR